MATFVHNQLVVSAVLKQVWRTFQEYRAHFVRLMFIVGTAGAIFIGIAFVMQPSLQPGQTPEVSNVVGFFLSGLLFGLAYAVLYIMSVVACHRCVLLGERTLEFAEWSARVIRYAFRAFLVSLLSIIPGMVLIGLAGPMLLSLLPKNPIIDPIPTMVSVTMFLVAFVIYTPIAYVAGRLSLVLPAVAVDRKLTLNKSWSVTEGNGWRLAVLLGLIPVGIPLALEGAIEFGLGKGTHSESVVWALSLFECYFRAAMILATAVILSTCFRELSKKSP